MHKPTVLLAILAIAGSAESVSNVSSDSIAAPQIRLLNDPGPVLQARFGKAPPPGVHPRVLISPEQLPSLQRLLQSTVTGKFVLAKLESYLDNLHVPGKPLAAAYDHLAAGDPAAYSYAASESWKGYVFFAVSMECYDAMIRQDESRGKRAGAALATLAKITKGWSNNDSDLANFALGYDYDYGYMTDEERTIVRQTISGATYGKKLPSADLPPDWRDNNSIPRGIVGQFLSALAIEGEKGYDPSIYPSSLGIMKDFLHFGITQTGGPLEEMHYFHYGMQLGSLAMVACARRGDNLFAEPRYRALANWLIASMEPFGDAFSMHQDTPNDQGGLATNYAIMKWVWPDDATLDMVWRNRIRPDYDGLSYFGDWSAPLLFPSDPKGWPLYSGKSPQSKWGINEVAPPPPGYPDPVAGITALKLPLSYWDPERGLLISRNKWGSDGMVVHFDINSQALGLSHFHSNSTMFTLSALERKWAIDRGFHIPETKDSSSILIDGRGQGFFPVGGTTAEYREEGKLTVIAGDAAEPYRWMTITQGRSTAPYLAGFVWEPHPRSDIVKKYAEAAKIDKEHPWNDKESGPNYPVRASYNPVEKAFRTVALRRDAPHSYILIVDDIKKDKKTHQYDWDMAVPDDLVITSNRDGGVVLGSADPRDSRRLLVQLISGAPGKWQLESYQIVRSPETGDNSSLGTGRRLKYSAQAIEPAFKVLLYPYREGSALPGTSANPNSVSVTWPEQKDRFDLNPLPSGRTEMRMAAGQ